VFVVDVGGAPRAFVGPVARGFEHVAPLSRRLKDGDVPHLKRLGDPWASSYTVPAPRTPALSLLPVSQVDGGQTWAIRSGSGSERVTLELLGHHRAVLGRASRTVGTSFAPLTVTKTLNDDDFELVRVRVGDFSEVFPAWSFYAERTFGSLKPMGDEAFNRTVSRLQQANERASQ
jgi:hypothetical protein